MDTPQLEWPEDFPEQCPPTDAELCADTVYRIVQDPIDTFKDFQSKFDRDARFRNEALESGDDKYICKSRGLSVFGEIEGAQTAIRKIPFFRKNGRVVACGTLNEKSGRMKPTHSPLHHSHITWWVALDVDASNGFIIVDE